MYRRSVWIALTLIIALWAYGCGSKDTPVPSRMTLSGQTSPDKQEEALGEAPRPTGQVAFHVTYVRRSRRVAKPAAVDTMTAYVYEPAGQKIAEQNLDHVGSRWKALITVPAGDDRRVDLAAYDGDLVRWLGADMDVDVIVGATTTADITMKEFVPDIVGLDSLNIEGTYTVRWSGVEDAIGYTLEESPDGTFSSPASYAMSDTVRAITHAEDGTYWYRVKAACRYGDGKWGTAQSIEVAILGVPELAEVPSPDSDGAYTVAWSAASHAEGYVVEEDDNAAFSSPTEVYRGSELSVERSGMAQATYWYRTKATNAYGESAWSTAVSVAVVLTKGMIEIDIPEPPEDTATFDLPGGATMEMVWIEPGTFTMGSPSSEPGRGSDEGPQHEVTITKGFWMGKVELTQAQWESVMGTRPWAGQSFVQENPNHPAVYISWNDVQAFLAKLNEAEGSEVYRLPTEAEWEYACRAGTTTRWSFGDDESQLGEYAWYRANAWDVGEQYAHAVGTKLPNPWGVHDLHGNVWEWCQDWYGSYSSSPQTDPTGPATGSRRVLRGGHFYNYARHVRSAYRYFRSPDSRYRSIGARLVRQGQ